MMEVMSDVFLSYSRRSRKHAEVLTTELEALGVSVWSAPKEIQQGEPVAEVISQALREARLVAFLVESHPSGASSGWLQQEYRLALEHSWSDEGKILIPVLVGDAQPPPFLRHALALKVRERGSDWSRVAKAISRMLSEGNSVRRSKAPMKEQSQRLNLIEKEAQALRVTEAEQLRK